MGERTMDGFSLGLAYALGQLAAYLFHAAFKTGYGTVIVEKLSDGRLDWLWSSSIRGFLIGFVIGFFIVRDIRRVSHSHVVELSKRRSDQPQPQPRPQAEQAEPGDYPEGVSEPTPPEQEAIPSVVQWR